MTIVPPAATTIRVNPGSLRRHREAMGLSLGELAKRADTNYSHLSNIEAGRRRASLELIKRLATALCMEHWVDLLGPENIEDIRDGKAAASS